VAQRPRALAEFVAIVDRLLAGYTGDHAGPHYPYQDAATTPGPVQRRVPIIISANGPRALAVAAEHGDGWVTFPGAATEEQVRSGLGRAWLDPGPALPVGRRFARTGPHRGMQRHPDPQANLSLDVASSM
jgi:alkanesulfonate monooxygenase SsuD/methylene tetrahydromethanopterin reductase-like flavin-dependent oxidoreductase (luciferase family)